MLNKKKLALALVLLLLVSVIGCGDKTGSDKKETGIIVATVNGENITKDDFDFLYNQVKQSYFITEEAENDPEQKEMLHELKLDILNQLISEKVVMQKASKAGFKITDEALAEAREEFNDIIVDIARQMEDMNMMAPDEEEKDYMSDAKEYIAEELESIGQTEEEYIEFIAQLIIVNDFREEMVKDVSVDDDEIESFYNDNVKIQQEEIPDLNSEEVVLYWPEEARVKHVLIKLPDEEIDEYMGILSQGQEKEAEEFLEKRLKILEPKATNVLDKVEEGEDFEKLIKEYGEDPGMEGNNEGYMVRRDGGDFVPEFEEAAFELQEGQVSGLVQSSYGYHIIKVYERNDAKTYSLEEKYDELKEFLEIEKKNDTWVDMIEKWEEAAKIKKFEDRI